MVTKTYLPFNLCDSSESSDTYDSSDSSDSGDSSDKKKLFKLIFFLQKTLFSQQNFVLEKNFFFTIFFYNFLFTTTKKFTKKIKNSNCDKTQKFKL